MRSQGLHKANAFGKGLVGAQKAIDHLGYVQIDTISVVERAHHHVLRSRISNYQPEMLNTLLRSKTSFEYWSHAAAFLPISDYRYSLPYKAALKSGQTHWNKNPDRKLMDEVKKQIEIQGPMRSRDFEQKKGSKIKEYGGWWDWKPAKKAIEQLFMEGDIMATERDGFQKVYDLTERVLPANTDTSMPSADEFAEHLIGQQLRCHGFVTLKAITYLRKSAALRASVKKLITRKLNSKELVEIRWPTGDTFLIEALVLEQPKPRVSDRLLILSPFDSMTIQRNRLSSIFNFDYQIECYVPAPKRKFGYFSLPLLYQHTFVGRMDCKAHRKEKRLDIKSLHFESNFLANKQFDMDKLSTAFVAALREFQHFQGCTHITFTEADHKHAQYHNLIQNIRRDL